MSFDLVSYLSKFPEACRKKFDGKTYDFASLEKLFRLHAAGKRPLTPKDIEMIFDPDKTPYKRYWLPPRTKKLEQALKEPLLLGPLPDIDERSVISQLLGVCHSIGTVSLVLRFVHPEKFGVFSNPILYLLQVSRPNIVDAYMAYCEELTRWKERFQIPTVAQTEMALWAYAQIAKGADADPAARKALENLEGDYWIQGRRVAQALGPFLQRYGKLELARIFLDIDPILAGKIAAEEYERLLDGVCRYLRGQRLWSRKPKGSPFIKKRVGSLIDELADKHMIRLEDKGELERIWETRNKAVHPSGDRPEREEVEVMIERISEICEPWERVTKKKQVR